MKSKNIIIGRIILLIIFSAIHLSVFSQGNYWFEQLIDEYDPENKIEVSIDRSVGDNDDHTLIDKIETKDYQFIKWLYFVNKKNEDNGHGKKKDNAPITYTLKEDGVIRYVRLHNCVEFGKDGDEDNDSRDFLGIKKLIGKIRGLDALEDQNLQGDLPKGTMTFINASRNRLKCGVNVPTSSAQVKIVINDLEGNLIATLVDEDLRKGWNNYRWERGRNPKGKYELSVAVDGQTMTQNFKVK